MNRDRRIVILGFMGCGKTTVAEALARRHGCEMIDLDSIISEQENQTVPELIKARGEDGFRRAETFALSVVLERKVPAILSLGGGAWTIDKNRSLIADHDCLTVFLDAPFRLCWKRISEQGEIRPLALDRRSAHKLYRDRQPVYQLADLRVEVDEDTRPDDLANQILSAMRRRKILGG